MPLFSDAERAQAQALAELSYCNPFLPERIDYEREVLGKAFVDTDSAWHKHAYEPVQRANIGLLTACAQTLADRTHDALTNGEPGSDEEHRLYEDVVLYYLYNKYEAALLGYIEQTAASSAPNGITIGAYADFQTDMAHYLGIPGMTFSLQEADHLFACFFQLRRAFHHIFEYIIGGSLVSARLRAAVWQSIFTCDMRRYRRTLYDRMGDITTLITGPSGTGKELVARAVGLSRYIPFDAKRKRPQIDAKDCFLPLNLSALSPTLIESELFGHVRGAFTGAVDDRAGYFEICSPHGVVFLDELGDLDPQIQVKLLRVLQTRTFQRIGDNAEHAFRGKIVAATNRDLGQMMHAGEFREDLYYRLCSDIIVTPSLRAQLKDEPAQLRNLLRFVAKGVAGAAEAQALAEEVEQWITAHLSPDYPWPGNVRELEQCVRNVMVRNTYHPRKLAAVPPCDAFLHAVRNGSLSIEELLRHYCTLVYAETGTYQQTATRLGLDRRTVKNHIDPQLLTQYQTNA